MTSSFLFLSSVHVLDKMFIALTPPAALARMSRIERENVHARAVFFPFRSSYSRALNSNAILTIIYYSSRENGWCLPSDGLLAAPLFLFLRESISICAANCNGSLASIRARSPANVKRQLISLPSATVHQLLQFA